MTSARDRAEETFRETFGAEPSGVWAAPGRVNLIGEHTDYNDGLCLPIALPHRAYAAARRRDDDRLVLVSADIPDSRAEVELSDVAAGTPGGWASYAAGVLWALRDAGHEVHGLDVAVASDVPIGAGLSSSAALEGCVGAAASDLFGLGLLDSDEGRSRLAEVCMRAENVIAEAPTGGLDQAAAMRCAEGHALLLDCRDGSTRLVPFDLDAHDLELLVVDTRATHALTDGQYGERRSACEAAAEALGIVSLREIASSELESTLSRLDEEVQRRRVRHVVTEIQRVRDCVEALSAGDFAEVGRLFDASHESLRHDYEVTGTELDLVADTARAEGALGARMTGGGFGGSAIALVRRGTGDQVAAAVARAFAEAGLGAPQHFVATAAAPAERLA
ncbi:MULTISPECIES: galactokinase [Arsenicicoccus]|uniref:galactokinase n=1 Tax=Arsenicicoccus TaxID=267408 RepID=UPI00257CE84F|nr:MULTISPECIES: galactokinase [Arsenicicoccus]